MRTLALLVGLLLVAAISGAAFVVSGAYDIGADSPHWRLTERIIGLLRDRSVAARTENIVVPKLDDESRVAEGAEHYGAMCSGCHLAPGKRDSEIRPGLYPKPPVLAEVRDLDPREAFWIIKHGIKMSGMPAWGTTHSDEAIWNIVAFLEKLPDMTPERYRALAGDHAGEAHDHGAGDDDHEHEGAHESGNEPTHAHDADHPAPSP